jgi:epoxyqueuosine reductase
MGQWVFGCDVCQEVCPWNSKFAVEANDQVLGLDPTLEYLDVRELEVVSDHQFAERFGHTALERSGAAGMRRNARIASNNV